MSSSKKRSSVDDICIAILLATSFLESQNLAHRDYAPEIWLLLGGSRDKDIHAVLSDFSAAVRTDRVANGHFCGHVCCFHEP